MRFTTAAFITLTLSSAAFSSSAMRAQQPAGKSVWDGVYTAEQAKRGEATYQKECSSCHGGDLNGDGFAPALTGAEFTNTWNGTTLGDLFERMRISMPPSGPESVSPQSKADILSFVLKSSKFPEGKAEIAPQTEMLKGIQFQANKQ
jgi:S-disulfanyl-L-cysteine oxidoreductase SoxD